MKEERGTVLIIFVGMLATFIATFICAFNIYSVIRDQQDLRNIVDQAALSGTNQIDLNSYYNSQLVNNVNLNSSQVENQVRLFIKSMIKEQEILNLNISIIGDEVSVTIEKKSKLPFGIGLNYVTVSAVASAKLQVS